MDPFAHPNIFRHQLLAEIHSVFTKARDEARVFLQQVERSERSHYDRRGESVREEIRPRSLSKVFDERLRAGRESPMRAAEGFTECGGIGVDLPEDAELLPRPPPAFADDTGGMRV